MENVETLKGLIKVCNMDIEMLRRRLSLCENDLRELYADLFYAENGMERGQHFMFEGKEYVRVRGGRTASYIRAYAADGVNWKNIFRFDYSKIQPLPVEKGE